jgi:hypothetical protein
MPAKPKTAAKPMPKANPFAKGAKPKGGKKGR